MQNSYYKQYQKLKLKLNNKTNKTTIRIKQL